MDKNKVEEQYKTTKQTANLLNITPQGVKYLIDQGYLPFVFLFGKKFVKTSEINKYRESKKIDGTN